MNIILFINVIIVIIIIVFISLFCYPSKV